MFFAFQINLNLGFLQNFIVFHLRSNLLISSLFLPITSVAHPSCWSLRRYFFAVPFSFPFSLPTFLPFLSRSKEALFNLPFSLRLLFSLPKIDRVPMIRLFVLTPWVFLSILFLPFLHPFIILSERRFTSSCVLSSLLLGQPTHPWRFHPASDWYFPINCMLQPQAEMPFHVSHFSPIHSFASHFSHSQFHHIDCFHAKQCLKTQRQQKIEIHMKIHAK